MILEHACSGWMCGVGATSLISSCRSLRNNYAKTALKNFGITIHPITHLLTREMRSFVAIDLLNFLSFLPLHLTKLPHKWESMVYFLVISVQYLVYRTRRSITSLWCCGAHVAHQLAKLILLDPMVIRGDPRVGLFLVFGPTEAQSNEVH